jgi:hypothetical protein
MIFKPTVLCLAFVTLMAMPAHAQQSATTASTVAVPVAEIPADPQANGVIGHLAEVEGTVMLAHAGENAALVAADAPIRLNDVVSTGAGARASILFVDDTQIDLSENTELRVDQYVFNGEGAAENKGGYSFLRGAFYYASGLVAKKADPDVTLNVPNGSIGIRGTEVWGGVDDGAEGAEGAYGIFVQDGMVKVKTEARENFVSKGMGTMLGDRRLPPGAPKAWQQDKIERLRGKIAFRDPEGAKKRMAERRVKQLEKHNAWGEYRRKEGKPFRDLREGVKGNAGDSKGAKPFGDDAKDKIDQRMDQRRDRIEDRQQNKLQQEKREKMLEQKQRHDKLRNDFQEELRKRRELRGK